MRLVLILNAEADGTVTIDGFDDARRWCQETHKHLFLAIENAAIPGIAGTHFVNCTKRAEAHSVSGLPSAYEARH